MTTLMSDGEIFSPPVIDDYDLCEPVDILTPLAKTSFWDQVVSSAAGGEWAVQRVIAGKGNSFGQADDHDLEKGSGERKRKYGAYPVLFF